MEPDTTISTWLFLDSEEEASWYPQVGRNSHTLEFQRVYIHCTIVFFEICRATNPTRSLKLFTNVETLPSYDLSPDPNVILSELAVDVEQVPLSFHVPHDYYGAWRNQFYVFDVISRFALSDHSAARLVLLDSDCLVVGDLSQLFCDIGRSGAVAYDLGFEINEVINGITLVEMSEISQILLGNNAPFNAKYYGGEFVAIDLDTARTISQGFQRLWPKLLELNDRGLPKFNEEAHCLSFLLLTELEYFSERGSSYIDRIWTGLPPKPFTADLRHLQIPIWHVPSEKKYGLSRLYHDIARGRLSLRNIDSDDDMHSIVGEYVGIPRRSSKKLILDLKDALRMKILKSIS